MSANISHLNMAETRTGTKFRRPGLDHLERFSEAKKAMGEIYKDISEFIYQLYDAYDTVVSQRVPKDLFDEVVGYRQSISTITEMFSRDKMKVVFFGRTSNGKSTVINAMLHSKVLPQGMGHTTCCFLSVEGGSENEKFFVTPENEKCPIEELYEIGHALSADNSKKKAMGQDSLLRIFYPKSASKLLQNDVVILDSPGVDLSPEFDSWIDKHCLDADVFVLVCNAESILTQAEKNFFVRVSGKLSRPNVFILNNRWDASANATEKEKDNVRSQHRNRFVQFLVEELKVCSKEDADQRFFFISAKEMLESRLKAKGELADASQAEGFQRRAMEFTSFETTFEKIISQSAIKTKFESHERRAREIIQCLAHNIDTVRNSITREKQDLALNLELKNRDLIQCQEKFVVFERCYYEQLQSIRAEVHLKVSADFLEEISRLESIIDRFNDRFVDDCEHIMLFKKSLSSFIEKEVRTDLEDRCTGSLMSRIWTLENDMFSNVKELLGCEYEQNVEQIWRFKRPFKFNIIVNCHQLLEDFNEDLEFHFSLGLDAIIKRLISILRGRPITSVPRDRLSGMAYPQSAAYSNRAVNQQNKDADQFMVEMIRSSASYVANGGVGLVIVSALVYKSIGWRVIAAGAAVYGGLYAIERLRWNSHAKEQHLKDQIRSHLTVGMKQMNGIHTAQCEAQVTKELDETHHTLKVVVAGVHKQMREHCDTLKEKTSAADEVVKTLNILKGKTNYFLSSINGFATKFLSNDS